MSEIYIDISKPYPTSEEVFSHELNKNSSKHLTVALYEENVPFDLTNYGVTATFVCDGYLVAEDVGVTNKHDNLFTIDISSTNTYTILPGLMLIEFKITSGAAELYSVTAMQVKVVPSIRDNAQVTPESYGTVSEILQEVAEARGNFNSLDARLDADEAQINAILPIDYSKLRSDLQQVISSKQKHLEATVSDLDDSTFKSYLDPKTLYFLKFTGSAATALGGHGSGIMTVIPGSVIPNSGTTVKREIVFPTSTNEKYVQNVTLDTPNTYSAWNKVQTIDLQTVPKITVWDYSTSETNNFTVPTSFEGKLGDIVVITTGSGSGGKKFELVKAVTNAGITSYYWEELVTYDHIPKNLFRVADFQTISSVSALESLLSVNTVYPIKLTGSAAAAFEVGSGTYATVRIVPKATMIGPSSWSIIQVIEFPEIEGVTWAQNVATFNSVTHYLGWEKAYTLSAKKVTSGSTVALEDNTEYAGTNINSLKLTYPDGEFECYLTLTFASSGTITVTFPSSSYIGAVPEFDNGETWEISIKNGVIVAGKVTSGS